MARAHNVKKPTIDYSKQEVIDYCTVPESDSLIDIILINTTPANGLITAFAK